jgi:hypothetical protein
MFLQDFGTNTRNFLSIIQIHLFFCRLLPIYESSLKDKEARWAGLKLRHGCYQSKKQKIAAVTVPKY